MLKVDHVSAAKTAAYSGFGGVRHPVATRRPPYPSATSEMLLVENAVGRIADLLNQDRPVAFIPAETRERAMEIAAAARQLRYGFAVADVRSQGLVVIVMCDVGHEPELRRDAKAWTNGAGVSITVDQIERVYLWPGWFTAMAHSHGAHVGNTL